MRLKKTRKIALGAVCAAIATICVVVARFTPVGWVLLYAVAGAVTLLAVRLSGFGYGILTYCAASLISLTVLPYNLPYVLLIGLHALLREFLFGKAPRKAWRYVAGYAVLLGFFYGMSLGVFTIARDTFGLESFINAVGGVYVFAAIAAAALVVYDFVLAYLVRGLERAISKGGEKQKPKFAGEDPFAESAPDATRQTIDRISSESAGMPENDANISSAGQNSAGREDLIKSDSYKSAATRSGQDSTSPDANGGATQNEDRKE